MVEEPILINPETQKQNTPQLTEEEKKAAPEITSGYIIGIQPNGDLIFDILGQNTGIVQLLGLHTLAGQQINVMKDLKSNTGWPRLTKQLDSAIGMLKTILSTLSKQP